MYIHLTYYSGDRSLVENILKNEASAIVADKVFYLDAADNDGDAYLTPSAAAPAGTYKIRMTWNYNGRTLYEEEFPFFVVRTSGGQGR